MFTAISPQSKFHRTSEVAPAPRVHVSIISAYFPSLNCDFTRHSHPWVDKWLLLDSCVKLAIHNKSGLIRLVVIFASPCLVSDDHSVYMVVMNVYKHPCLKVYTYVSQRHVYGKLVSRYNNRYALFISLLYNTLRMVVTFWIFEKYLG